MLELQLLGRPAVLRDGAPGATPRGRKSWALLAYLVLSEVPPSRQRLIDLLFPDADDPSGALRWTLSRLRHQLGDEVSVGGDPVVLELPPDVVVDVHMVAAGDPEAARLPGIGRPLLEGVEPRASAAFELWLAEARRAVVGATADLLHGEVVAHLAANDVATALGMARRLVELTPLDEGAHTLLVRTMRAGGDEEGAAAHARQAADMLLRELGHPAASLLRDAATPPAPRRTHGRSTVTAQLEAGRAAATAGAHTSAVEAFRGAVAAARALDDTPLLAGSLLELGAALVHGVRGTDEEGATVLHEALQHARGHGLRGIAATAARELGYVDVLRGRYRGALRWLRVATEAAESADERAWISAVSSLAYSDVGDHQRALRAATAAIEQAERADAPNPGAFALTGAGRAHLLLGAVDESVSHLDDALSLARETDWTAFLPWPESLRADALLDAGEVDVAGDAFAHAFALGTQLGDPCWESIAERGLGRVAETRGDVDGAVELLQGAASACRRLSDTYVWVEAFALDALADLATEVEHPAAPGWVDELEDRATPRGMRELTAKAAIYRARLGVPGASERAGDLVEDLGNPRLDRELARLGRGYEAAVPGR